LAGLLFIFSVTIEIPLHMYYAVVLLLLPLSYYYSYY